MEHLVIKHGISFIGHNVSSIYSNFPRRWVVRRRRILASFTLVPRLEAHTSHIGPFPSVADPYWTILIFVEYEISFLRLWMYQWRSALVFEFYERWGKFLTSWPSQECSAPWRKLSEEVFDLLLNYVAVAWITSDTIVDPLLNCAAVT
jgi:hypothetical protein